MTRFGRQVHGLERATTLVMNNIEALHEAQKVTLLGVASGPAPLVEVADERGPADGAEDNAVIAEVEVMLGIACPQRKSSWCSG